MPELRKAAVLLTSLPEEEAGKLLAKLSPKQVEAVSIEIAKLGGVSGGIKIIDEHATMNDK